MKRALLLALLALGCGGGVKTVHFAREPLGVGGARLPTPDASFRSTAPHTAVLAPFVPPPIAEARLSNGIRVLYLERHDFPVVTVRLVSSHGSDQAPLGVGAMWARLVFRGPDGKERGKIGRAFAAHGADVSPRVNNDTTSIRLEVLSGDYRRSIEILGEAIGAATFPASGLEEARDLQMSTIARRGDDPHVLASLKMYETLYPLGDRYHDDPGGTKDSIAAVTRDQLVAYHRAAIDAARLSIAVAGDFDPKVLLPELEKDFGKLADAKAPPLAKPTAPEKSTAPRLVLVDRPGASQATVIVAALGVAYDHADRLPLEVLRGRLSAAVYFNLREEHAFTYGAGSHVVSFRRPGPVFVEGAIDKEHTGEAISLIFGEIEKLRTTELDAEALADVRDDAMLDLARDFDSTLYVASGLATMGALGLPATHYVDTMKGIGAVTAADLKRVAATYFANDAIHVIVVGDGKALKAQLDAVGEGKVDVEKAPPETPETSE